MNTLNAQPGLWSIRCYRLLMRLYPASFRSEFGESVDQTFRDMIRDAFKKRGYMGIALLWFRTVPDFVFSAFELLTSTSGDYLKWYFRLRWILACAVGMGAGALIVNLLGVAGFFEYFGLPRHWGLLGFPLWLCLGLFQSLALSDQFCHRSRWVSLTVLGGMASILGSLALSKFIPLRPIHPDVWESWVMLPVVAILPAIVNAARGAFQWFAFRRREVPMLRWIVVCAIGGYFSGLLTFPLSIPMGVFGIGMVLGNSLTNATAGALFGIATAGPLKRLMWPPSGEQQMRSESAESVGG